MISKQQDKMIYSLQKDNETIIELSDDFVNPLIKDLQELAEALQCALSLITDEEELREIIAGTRSGP